MITGILRDIGLAPSHHDPCLFTGIIGDPDRAAKTATISPSPANLARSTAPVPKATATSIDGCAPIRVGVYIDDFIFYSTDPEEEELFKKELAWYINVNFMGNVNYCLGTAFSW